MNIRSIFHTVALLFGSLSVVAQAQVSPEQLQSIQSRVLAAGQQAVADCNIAQLPYRANGKTQIYPRFGKTVTLGFQPDETITTVIWDETRKGDLIEDYVYPDQRTYTVRAKVSAVIPGVVTTTSRRYFLLLIPTESGPCNQGVIFGGSDGVTGAAGGFNPFGTTIVPSGTASPSVTEVAPIPRPADDVFTGEPNFNYAITGDASIRPMVVYDNGKFTWIYFANTVQNLPAVFYSGVNGLEVVNFTPINRGAGILVSRLMDKIVLKLGNAEVIITAGAGKR